MVMINTLRWDMVLSNTPTPSICADLYYADGSDPSSPSVTPKEGEHSCREMVDATAVYLTVVKHRSGEVTIEFMEHNCASN